MTQTIGSLAVLPLENVSNDPEQDYFADGMTEELTTELAQMSQLKVISHTSVVLYKFTKESLPRIARDLGVDAVVEGAVERSGERVGLIRITFWHTRVMPLTWRKRAEVRKPLRSSAVPSSSIH